MSLSGYWRGRSGRALMPAAGGEGPWKHIDDNDLGASITFAGVSGEHVYVWHGATGFSLSGPGDTTVLATGLISRVTFNGTGTISISVGSCAPVEGLLAHKPAV